MCGDHPRCVFCDSGMSSRRGDGWAPSWDHHTAHGHCFRRSDHLGHTGRQVGEEKPLNIAGSVGGARRAGEFHVCPGAEDRADFENDSAGIPRWDSDWRHHRAAYESCDSRFRASYDAMGCAAASVQDGTVAHAARRTDLRARYEQDAETIRQTDLSDAWNEFDAQEARTQSVRQRNDELRLAIQRRGLEPDTILEKLGHN